MIVRERGLRGTSLGKSLKFQIILSKIIPKRKEVDRVSAWWWGIPSQGCEVGFQSTEKLPAS